jgi:hypothetical protein
MLTSSTVIENLRSARRIAAAFVIRTVEYKQNPDLSVKVPATVNNVARPTDKCVDIRQIRETIIL